MSNKFASYVQSVAFQMTLSRNMIEALGLIRDFQTIPHDGSVTPRVDTYAAPSARSLKRRGLVEHWSDVHPELEGPGWSEKIPFVWRLTRAGELTCELLVEADLLPVAKKQARRKVA